MTTQLQRRTGDHQVVAITGASSGVGRATAHRFAREGATLALLARGEERLAATRAEVESLGGRALTIGVDVADSRQVFEAADRIERELGPIDIWINGAMTTVFARVVDTLPDEYRRATEVTYLGVVWGTQAALSKMRRRNRGTIVQVGSALAYRSIPLQAAYCGAKAAIRAFTDSLRAELIHDRIDVHLCMVQLPGLNTPQFRWCLNKMPFQPQPVPPIFQPEIAADSIHYAAHHHRREIYVGRSTVQAVLGTKLLPGLLDHYLAHAAFEGQFTDEPRQEGRPHNLFEPPPGDYSTHGPFDERAQHKSALSRVTTRLGATGVRGLVAGAPLLTLGLLALPWWLRRARRTA